MSEEVRLSSEEVSGKCGSSSSSRDRVKRARDERRGLSTAGSGIRVRGDDIGDKMM